MNGYYSLKYKLPKKSINCYCQKVQLDSEVHQNQIRLDWKLSPKSII